MKRITEFFETLRDAFAFVWILWEASREEEEERPL